MDVQAHRKLRLRELINDQCEGVIARFADKVMRSESYIARMLYPMDKPGAKPIADKLMLAIEHAFGLERAWLDKPLGYKDTIKTQLGNTSGDAVLVALKDWRIQASERSRQVIDQLSVLAQKDALRDEDWTLIEQLAARLRKKPS